MEEYVITRLNRELMMIRAFGEPTTQKDKMKVLFKATNGWVTAGELGKFLKGRTVEEVLNAYLTWFSIDDERTDHLDSKMRYGFLINHFKNTDSVHGDIERLKKRMEDSNN